MLNIHARARSIALAGYPTSALVAINPLTREEVRWCPVWQQFICFKEGHAFHYDAIIGQLEAARIGWADEVDFSPAG